ncbi:DUF421 domain-containing protein [Mycobacterium tilburgii]|uniref:DUF421 domain-containing protein n=1 Tax=Mycobacterium tilburgii TaxID=44467 RepID=UPI0021B320F5|nr:DUF421 domain-containing protein [Mycobacterium tilburgii]
MHAVLARLRFAPGVRRFIDPPLKVLIRNGRVEQRNLRRCGLTTADLEAVLRQHSHESPEHVHLAIIEAKGAISILESDEKKWSGGHVGSQSRHELLDDHHGARNFGADMRNGSRDVS